MFYQWKPCHTKKKFANQTKKKSEDKTMGSSVASASVVQCLLG